MFYIMLETRFRAFPHIPFSLSAGVHVFDVSIAVAMLMGRHNLGAKNRPQPAFPYPSIPTPPQACFMAALVDYYN